MKVYKFHYTVETEYDYEIVKTVILKSYVKVLLRLCDAMKGEDELGYSVGVYDWEYVRSLISIGKIEEANQFIYGAWVEVVEV